MIWLHRYAKLLVCATLLLVAAGGMVTSTSAGLSVPDWPTTYGRNMFAFPLSQMVGGIFYEHGHRLIASTVGFLTIGLVIWVWRVDPRRWMRGLALCALGAVAGLVVISIWHPLVEARYASVMWGPLVVLVGLGFAEIPWRRVAPIALAVTAVSAIVLSFALTEPDTPGLARRLNGHVGRHDLVASAPAAYLLLVHYGAATTRAHTRIVAADVPWYWGTAAFPRGAVLHAYPSDVLARGGTIDLVDVPGQPRAIVPPPPYRMVGEPHCFSTICLTVYRPPSRSRRAGSAALRSSG